MGSLLQISNKALRKLGITEIASLSQQGQAAARCNAAVEDIVKEVLCLHPWRHATVWATLPQLSTAPAFGYEYAYQAPVESYRVFDVRGVDDLRAPNVDFEEVRGKKIYTDVELCYARYVVWDVDDLAMAYPDFINTCAWKLAYEIATPLSKTSKMDKMLQGYLYELEVAKLNDASASRERGQDENRTSSILREFGHPNSEMVEEGT
jgi:hypothetical protein